MTDQDHLRGLRTPTEENPLRILVSACLIGVQCGYDGSSNGEYPNVLSLLKHKNAKLISFCPEEFSFGSPREMCDIHGGNGDDVLDGKAKFLSESGIDWTEGIIRASEKMLEVARQNSAEICLMMDVSGACGSQVIYDGNRFGENKVYQIGKGVCAAQLVRNGFKVISQRDYASLEILFKKLDRDHKINPSAIDHHQHPWYLEYFGR